MNPNKWPCGTPRSTGNAFSGVIPHSIPLTEDFHFRTPIYSRWLVKCKDAGSLAPSWEAFRDAALSGPAPNPKHKQMPMQVSTVKPIKGLSKQAQAQLAKAPKSIGLDKLSDGHRRSRIKKAGI